MNTQPALSSRQARWNELISEYDFTIVHIAGKSSQVADSLSRPEINSVSSVTLDDHLLEEVKEAYSEDELCKSILNSVKQSQNNKQQQTESEYQLVNGLIYNKSNALLIPKQQHIIQRLLHEVHQSQLSSHQGINKTVNNAKRLFY